MKMQSTHALRRLALSFSLGLTCAVALTGSAFAGEDELPTEADFYRIATLDIPAPIVLEVSGICLLPDGRPMVATRRGEVWIIDGAYDEKPGAQKFTLFTDGLQEPLGLLVHKGWIYCTQRGELSRMRDLDGDDRMDELETVCDTWKVNGNYHEYNFGPRLDKEGNLWITTNRAFGGTPFGSRPWRGFAMRIDDDGKMIPTCCGLRSPAGLEISPAGDAFYTDNQGEWCGASKLAHLEPGDFHGHPYGLASCNEPEWPYKHPGDPPNKVLMPEVKKTIPTFKLPAVWFPYNKMGKSPAGMVWDQSDGAWGPFAGQLFVSDQNHACVMRVFLERVNGRWQGACFQFRNNFQCGIIRVAWGADGSMLIGETNRGWGSKGSKTEGMERLIWTGKTPFEVQEMHALKTGFELTFTKAVDRASLRGLKDTKVISYTYELHQAYGSAEMDKKDLSIKSFKLSSDGLKLVIDLDGLRAGYVHEFIFDSLRSKSGVPLLHPEAYYSLMEIPEV